MRIDWLRHVPNALSIFRIFLGFVFLLLPPAWRVPAIVAALLSEFFDGYLARRWNAVTRLGQILDPVADKIFVLFTVIALISEGRLALYQFALIAMRDIVVAIGSFSVMFESRQEAVQHLQPKLSGKVTTGLQFALLISLFANLGVSYPLYVVTAVSSSISAIDYLYAVLHRRFDSSASNTGNGVEWVDERRRAVDRNI